MTDIILTITIAFLLLIIVNEFSTWAVYGGIIKDSIINESLDINIPKGLKVNPYEISILYIGEMPFISTNFSLISRYHISDTGRILRFTKADKRIKEIYTKLNGTKEDRIKTRLKIK